VREARNVCRRSGIAIGIIVATLILSTAVPAHSATKLRVYKGETSQGDGIRFKVARTETGRRFIREMDYGVTFTCEDQTTQDWGIGWGLANSLPITDRVFSFDEAFSDMATHIAGRLGPLAGDGTMTVTIAALTEDEQAQLCTTGDLTWEVEFVRVVIRSGLDAPAGFVARAA
jgi:hypothetical protein